MTEGDGVREAVALSGNLQLGVWVTLANDRGAVLVDREVHEDVVAAGPWYLHNNGYASRVIRRPDGGRTSEKLHHFVWLLSDDKAPSRIDHTNRDPADNRRSNLRAANQSQNCANRRHQRNATSGFKGVSKLRGGWRARLMVNRTSRSLGVFATAEDAARAYDKAALEHFGPFAATNVSLGILPPFPIFGTAKNEVSR